MATSAGQDSSNDAALLAARHRVYGPNAALSYAAPLHVVRGEGARLYDAAGAAYLDCVNNVAHVGHANAAVAEAVGAQMRAVNTNSRYLSQGLVDLSEALLARLPPHLTTVFLVNSGSEANDLALRVSRAAAAAAGRPNADHVAVMGGAYHGHLTSTMALSPYKFWAPGGAGRAPWVHVLPCPDPFRGRHLDGARAARGAAAEAAAAGGGLCAFICESVLSCGGQVFLPDGYLADAYREMRAAGAICIADEVQCGFGRVGAGAFWGFELSGVLPDIVVMGKPIGNGFPLAAVAVTRALADAFATQEYFNTFGGCNAATAAGLAVMREIDAQRLQSRGDAVGAHLLAQLQRLQARHPDVVGDVRGRGLFVGVEIVRGAACKRPAPATAKWLKETARGEFRVLLSTDGPFENVVKIKPPMVFSAGDADELVGALSALLARLETDGALRAALAAQEEEAYASRVAPLAAVYEANAARIYALADAAAAAAGGVPAAAAAAAKAADEPWPLPVVATAVAASSGSGGDDSPHASSSAAAAATVAPKATAAAALGSAKHWRPKGLFARVKSWGSRSDSAMSSASDWEPAPAAAAVPTAGAHA